MRLINLATGICIAASTVSASNLLQPRAECDYPSADNCTKALIDHPVTSIPFCQAFARLNAQRSLRIRADTCPYPQFLAYPEYAGACFEVLDQFSDQVKKACSCVVGADGSTNSYNGASEPIVTEVIYVTSTIAASTTTFTSSKTRVTSTMYLTLTQTITTTITICRSDCSVMPPPSTAGYAPAQLAGNTNDRSGSDGADPNDPNQGENAAAGGQPGSQGDSSGQSVNGENGAAGSPASNPALPTNDRNAAPAAQSVSPQTSPSIVLPTNKNGTLSRSSSVQSASNVPGRTPTFANPGREPGGPTTSHEDTNPTLASSMSTASGSPAATSGLGESGITTSSVVAATLSGQGIASVSGANRQAPSGTASNDAANSASRTLNQPSHSTTSKTSQSRGPVSASTGTTAPYPTGNPTLVNGNRGGQGTGYSTAGYTTAGDDGGYQISTAPFVTATGAPPLGTGNGGYAISTAPIETATGGFGSFARGRMPLPVRRWF